MMNNMIVFKHRFIDTHDLVEGHIHNHLLWSFEDLGFQVFLDLL